MTAMAERGSVNSDMTLDHLYMLYKYSVIIRIIIITILFRHRYCCTDDVNNCGIPQEI